MFRTSNFGKIHTANLKNINCKPTGFQRANSSIFTERERALEEMEMRKYDQELIEKLRQSEDARIKAEQRAKEAENIYQEHNNNNKSFTSTSSTSTSAKSDFVSMEEFLTFRKEIIDRIRELEDDIHEIKFSKYKK